MSFGFFVECAQGWEEDRGEIECDDGEGLDGELECEEVDAEHALGEEESEDEAVALGAYPAGEVRGDDGACVVDDEFPSSELRGGFDFDWSDGVNQEHLRNGGGGDTEREGVDAGVEEREDEGKDPVGQA